MVMGVSAMITDIPIPAIFLSVDLWIMTAASLAIVPFTLAKSHVGRIWGFLFFASYIFFIAANFTLARAP
jgi:cation:H+ antiporter